MCLTNTMLKLPDVTLVLLTNRDFNGAKLAIDRSCENIDFGDVKIIWDEKCNSIDEWNRKMIFELPDYVRTSHAMVIHQDGYIKRPDLWDSNWLSLDYIGAPWPLPADDFSYIDEAGRLQRVGNSVSLRSKKLMDLVASRPVEYFWEQKEKYGNTNEDGFICCHNRFWLEMRGCKFATLEQAVHFSKEHEIEENVGVDSFAFHTVDV